MGFVSPHDDADEVDAAANRAIDSESSFARYKAVLSNWRLLVAGLAIGFQERGPLWPAGVGPRALPGRQLVQGRRDGGDRSALDQHCAAGGHGGRGIQQWLGVGQALQFAPVRSAAAIVLYMVLAAFTSLYM